MGNIPCATGRESGGQAVVIPGHCEWSASVMGYLQLEIVARLGAVVAVFAGVVVCGGMCCAAHTAGGVPVAGVSSRAQPMSHTALQGSLTKALFTGHSH